MDSSVFSKLLLDEPGADKAQKILEAVESNRVVDYIMPLILEEVAFKLIYAKASELLNTRSIWRVREALRHDKGIGGCCGVVEAFRKYVDYMLTKGLRVEYVGYEDWKRAVDVMERSGLLPADTIHVAVMKRLDIDNSYLRRELQVRERTERSTVIEQRSKSGEKKV